MANTRRKTTVSFTVSREGHPDPLVERYKNNSAIYLARQESCGVPRNSLDTIVPLIAKTAATAAILHTHQGGATVSVCGGNMAGLPRFAVSIYPQRTIELIVVPTWEMLFAFAIINADLLLLPDHALGSWFDGEQNRHILDVVVCPLSLDEAIRLGSRYDQKAIYDLEARREISLAASI